jgi:hypothetical protein
MLGCHHVGKVIREYENSITRVTEERIKGFQFVSPIWSPKYVEVETVMFQSQHFEPHKDRHEVR